MRSSPPGTAPVKRRATWPWSRSTCPCSKGRAAHDAQGVPRAGCQARRAGGVGQARPLVASKAQPRPGGVAAKTMSLNAQALRLLAEKGLTASDIAELAEALEVRRDPTAAERMRRYRAKKEERVTVTRNVTVEPSPNDNILTPSGFDVSDETSAVCDFADEVVEVWNREISGTPLPAARKLTPERRKHLNARVKVHGKEAVSLAIRAMCQSDFHSGKSGKWVHGNLGWLLKNDENFTKMLERKPAEQAASSGKQWT